MGKKYYTPQLSEFCHELEFEFLEPFYESGTERKWTTFKMYSGRLSALAIQHNCISIGGFTIKDENIRVKYLDEEDLIELGWQKKNNEYWMQGYVLTGQLQYQNVTIEYEQSDAPMGEWTKWRDIKFDGKIKNKAELKKIMRMLDIKPFSA